MTSLSFARLVDLVEGRLSETEQQQLLSLLNNNPQAQADLAWLQQTIAHMRSDSAEDAPSHVVNRALRLLRQKFATARPSLWRQFTALLRFDSWQSQPAVGVRSASSAPRQMLYEAGEHEIDLRVMTDGSHWFVAGQVIGSDALGEVELVGLVHVSAPINALSEFRLPAVPPGNYTLIARQSDVEIVIPGLVLA
jgi:anti-sigma factor RsiW